MMLNRRQRVAEWMLTTSCGRVALKVSEWASLLIGVLAAALVTHNVEEYFFPVITDWKLTYITREKDVLVMGGVMTKARSCELVSTSILAVPKMPLAPRQLVYQIKPSEILGGNAPYGTATWGPWEMRVPKVLDEHRDEISSFDIVGYHRCHAFWLQETYYGSVNIKDVP